MTIVRFIKDLTCSDDEPLVYVYHRKEGWFLLRQIIQLFFPEINFEQQMKFKLWTARHISTSQYYRTSLRDCFLRKIRDYKIKTILKDANIASSEYIINVESTHKLLSVLDPQVNASTFLTFNSILLEIHRKGGRKRAITAKERMQIAAGQDWRCYMCKELFGKNLNFEIDHIHQFSKGGSNRRLNLQALCSNCHREKTEREKQFIFKELREY
jgi:hypothetical protein